VLALVLPVLLELLVQAELRRLASVRLALVRLALVRPVLARLA
jgi:hypothetical protein